MNAARSILQANLKYSNIGRVLANKGGEVSINRDWSFGSASLRMTRIKGLINKGLIKDVTPK